MSQTLAVQSDQAAPALPALRQPDSLLNIIAAAAENPAVDVGKLQALLDMQKAVVAEQARLQFNAAMAQAQAEMLPVTRDAMNSHSRSRYARLETIDAKVRPIYTRHGFALSFDSNAIPGGVRILCRVSHSAGHEQNYTLEGALDGEGAKGAANKTPIQALGSSTSYLRRYLTLMIFNITLTNEDDDGATARRPAVAVANRLDEAERAITGEPPDDVPHKSDGTNPAMAKWVADIIASLDRIRTVQRYFVLVDGIKANRDVLMQEAPELDARLAAALKAKFEALSVPSDPAT